jgi:hypothetical protein
MKAVSCCRGIRNLRNLDRRTTLKLFSRKSMRRENAAWVLKNTQEGNTTSMSEVFSKRKVRLNR